MIDDDRWAGYGVTAEFLEERAVWLRELRSLHSNSGRFFEVAASLVRFSRYDYCLASVAFFQAIPGLEQALKLHFRDDEGRLRSLLEKAAAEGSFSAVEFGDVKPFTQPFARSVRKLVGSGAATRIEVLVKLLPELRNQYFHGVYLLAPDYLDLTCQVRQLADVLNTKRRQWLMIAHDFSVRLRVL